MSASDPVFLIVLGLAAVMVLLVVMVAFRAERGRAEMAQRLAQIAEHQAGATAQLQQRLIDHERAVGERLDNVGHRVGASLEQTTNQTKETLSRLGERLAVMDEAQKNITELSTRMVSLQDILSNKQARGAFGEIQLNDLVERMLPPDTYQFQATVGGNRRVDCLIRLPNPPGPIGIDSKFPLESYRRLTTAEDEPARVAAERAFRDDVRRHVVAIEEKYIVPGETAEAALMFLPSEAIYAEIHARHPALVEESFRRKVFIVSPTTLWATLNTVRAIFRDVRLREQAGIIQKELHVLLTDVGRLDDRVSKLSRHFGQAEEDLRQIQTSTGKITSRAERMQALELENEDGASATEGLAPPATAGRDAAE